MSEMITHVREDEAPTMALVFEEDLKRGKYGGQGGLQRRKQYIIQFKG